MPRHINIPIFIPHLGCPNQCVFCNQRIISGKIEFKLFEVDKIIESSLSTVSDGDEAEIAFFGGSFTGIDRNLMISLLEIAKKYVDKGRVRSVRLSTRPDYIDSEILDILKKYSVSDIEIGFQSTSDSVLDICKRGHTREQSVRAARLIRESGFRLVGQMMLGLPGADEESELETAEFIIGSGAVAARIYPTVVFRDTELAALTERGEYLPLTLDEAVRRASRVARKFIDADVELLRIGLCSSDNLSSADTYLAGPNHAALGELVLGEIYYENIIALLEREQFNDKRLTVAVAHGELSKAIGHKRRNKNRLITEKGYECVRFVTDESLSPYEVRLLKDL